MTKMAYLYTLQLQSGKYYVGKSDDPDTRYLAHKNGNGAAWTKIHRPVKLLEIRELKGEHDETNTTKDLMKKYGIDNVRGGSYTQSVLDDATKAVLEREILGNTDKCYKCAQSGHFANRCPNKKVEVEEEDEWGCDHCDMTFTSMSRAIAHEKRCTSNPAVYTKTIPKKKTGACYRCGRTSHYSPDCYAQTHVNGDDLESDDD
jgi:predicted GIY-YIG superfamily endonuclease